MKNLKRIIALVAVFALALTTMASAASFTDVADSSAYYRAVEQLHKIGIIDGYTDGTFKPEQTVTRAEMAKLIAAMQGYAESAEGKSVTKFSDVPSTHWASGYIASATGTAINGLPDGTFAPDKPVKYEEAVKMIMATLGYTVIAEAEGGYPMGYVSAAIKEKVTADVTNANIGTDASRGTIAQLIYNAIDTPLVEQITWNKDGTGDYIKYDGETKYGGSAVEYKTLMSENLEIVKAEGVVMNNSYFGLTEDITSIDLDEDAKVTISVNKIWGDDFEYFTLNDEAELLVADSDAMDYVGYAVEFYAQENDYEEWEVLSILKAKSFNKEITFNLSSYDEKESADADANVIYYYKDNATTSTKVTLQNAAGTAGNVDYIPGYEMMYNFKAFDGDIKATLAALKDADFGGQVTLIDNDKFTGYDAVIIEAAVSDVVDEIKTSGVALKNGVKTPDGGRIKLADDLEDALVVITKDGEAASFDDIAEDDVLSIIGRKDGAFTVVDIMSNIVEGTISSTKSSKTSANDRAYKIDGTWYDVAYGAEDALAGVVAGEGGSFYIDKYGKIAYFVEGGTFTGNYAYVLDTLLDEDDWGNLAFSMKLLTKDGIAVYEAASKFTYNAGSDSNTVDVEDDMTDDNTSVTTGDGSVLKGQVIDFTLSSGKVKKITVEGYAKNDADPNFEYEDGIVNDEFDAEDLSIGSLDFDEDTIVFYIDTTTTENSYVGTLADLEDKAVVNGGAYVDKHAEADANIAVLIDAVTTISPSTGLAVVVDFESGSNDEEDDIYTLTLLYEGEEVTYDTTADVYNEYAGDLTVGDIVKIKVTGAGVITKMASVFDFEEDVRGEGDVLKVARAADVTLGVDPADDIETITGGYAFEYKKTSKKIVGLYDYDGTEIDDNEYSISKAKNVYVIDGTGRDLEVYAGAAGDYEYDAELINEDLDGFATNLEDGTGANWADVVIFRTFDGDVVDAVIIKGSSDWTIAD
ncbi:MAG: S-layer homology domain-containing protein [Ruminococcaceae bacterium]|nr:S-layer homology domain-containing protein [Oscillospiraceae bacterium]